MAKSNTLRVISYEKGDHELQTLVREIREHDMPTEAKARRRKFMRLIGQLYDENSSDLGFAGVHAEWVGGVPAGE